MADNRNPAPDDQNGPTSTRSDGNEQWVILNPTSGTADHVDDARQSADERNYTIQETTREEHAVQLAQDAAANDVDRLAVAGGDGTLHVCRDCGDDIEDPTDTNTCPHCGGMLVNSTVPHD
ncbi:diacylglycerol kinase family protein [Haloferax sp. DFSO60]|uniref:diacylglycerol kinase family protein n=1 Tax=Haloferax sp. DFSO60 TaxID=3388652 RepID=UPI003978F554